MIEECLKTQESDMREAVFDKIVEYELLIPRMEVEVSEKMIRQKAEGRFKSIYDRFVGSDCLLYTSTNTKLSAKM